MLKSETMQFAFLKQCIAYMQCILCNNHVSNSVIESTLCQCEFGKPVKLHGICNSENRYFCESCHPGYTLNETDNTCTQNSCVCDNGTGCFFKNVTF